MTLLTCDEVAAQVRLSPALVRRACREGELEAYRPARNWRIPEQAVSEWLHRSRPEPPALRLHLPQARVAIAANFGRRLRAIESNTEGP
ncbi:MAG: excisionase family DNA-binding protein [Thermoleophilaceae bacterium]